jgi:hypothetical protein
MPRLLVISQSKTSRKFISSICTWETYVWNLQITWLKRELLKLPECGSD